MLEAAQTVLKDPSILKATVFCGAAVAGQIGHVAKKWSEGLAVVLPNLKMTVGAVIANLVGMAGFISTGALDGIQSIGTVIALGIFMGFSADSAVNRGVRQEWTEEERAQKAGS